MHVFPLKCHFYKRTTVFNALNAGMLLDHDVVLQVLAAEIKEVDAGLGQIACIQDALDRLDLAAQNGVLVPPLVVGLALFAKTRTSQLY